jgi:glycosyltransferase involved in cell wall biosynthesis
MPRPIVTVLMAVHDTEPYVRESIDSVLGQSLTDLQLIIVDDASSDSSWEIAMAAAARDERIIARRRDVCGGASAALNDGLALATGDYITRQDADDVSEPRRLEAQVAFLHARPECAGVGTQARFISPEGAPLAATSFPTRDAELQARLIETMCFIGPTVMTRRATLAAAEFRFDPDLSGSEDYDLCLRLAERGALANLPDLLYLYRQHPASVSHSRRHVQLARKARALENAVARRYAASPPAAAMRAVARDFFRAAVMAHLAGDREALGANLRRALHVDPPLLEDTRLVEQVLRRYLPSAPDDALPMAESLFDDALPHTSALQGLRRTLTAEIHLRGALSSKTVATSAGRRHLWSAFRGEPRLLLDRDVLSRLLRGAFGRSAAPQPELRP